MNLYGNCISKSKQNSVPDPLCKLKLNLRKTSEFVKSFPMSNGNTDSREVSAHRRREGSNSVTRRRLEAPSTPSRPVFSFSSVGNLSRKCFPSKWDDAEKWLMSTSCRHSPPHTVKVSEPSNIMASQGSASLDLDHRDTVHASNGISCSTHIMLKDKFTDSTMPIFANFQYSEPTREGFLFGDPAEEVMKDACKEVVHKDVGTEMTPLASCRTSRCHTPFKSSSPARHNTPASRSGPLSLTNHKNTTCTIDLIRLEECHFAKLQLGTQYDSVISHWSSREEEESEISKSLRHNASQKGDSDCRAATWEEEEKTKCCLRYQREEAKIQAWVNLQSAKAEAQSRKLEVKMQKMRSNLEEKLMKRMAVVHRKAEEWRAAARQQHLQQIQTTTEQAQKIMNQYNPSVSGHNSCGCFPCNNNHN
ncbi:Remorin, C-terminal [Spatholobus suberectus]|nr:Remorin, C-terminal [Spatholobus suberectus]